jgi:hypothetical protein
MRIDIEFSRLIIKLRIKYDYLLRIFKRIDHQENSIKKCSNRSRFWKKRKSFYKLDLSDEINIHSIFHISLLRKNFENSLSKQFILSSFSVVINDEQEFDVENIIDSRLIKKIANKKLQYKIKWIKHSFDRKWYFVENFDHAKKIIVDYHHRYFDKSRSHFLRIQFLIISLMTHFINSFSWAQKNIQKTKNLIKNILNKMKQKMKFSIIKQTSIFSVERNNINTKTINQDCFVIKTISVERILFNQNKKEDNVTISCQFLNQMIRIKRRVQYQED